MREAVGPRFVICCRLSQWCETDYGAKVASTPKELEVLLTALRGAGADAFHLWTRYFHEPEWPGDPRTIAGWVSSLTDAAIITVGSVGMNIDLMQSLWSEREEEQTLRSSLVELLAPSQITSSI